MADEPILIAIEPPAEWALTLEPPRELAVAIEVGQGPAGPPGGGDMSTLTYDPTGVRADAFDLSNLSGNLDCGEFT